MKFLSALVPTILLPVAAFAQEGMEMMMDEQQMMEQGAAQQADPTFIVFIAFLIFTALLSIAAVHMIARKTDFDASKMWWTFIPYWNVAVLVKLAGRPLWWLAPLEAGLLAFTLYLPLAGMIQGEKMHLVLQLVSGVVFVIGWVFAVLLGIGVAKERNMKQGWGVLLGLLPIVGLPVVAFAEPFQPKS